MKRLAAGAAVALVLGAAPAASAAGPRVVVVPAGGSVQAAVDQLHGHGTVVLRGGTFTGRVVVDGAHGLTLRAYPGEHPVLSGAGLSPSPGITGLLEITRSSKVTVSGLDITAYRSRSLGVTPAGIYVHGHDSRVVLRGNHVHDLGNEAGVLGSFDFGAHGIAAYGDDPAQPITGLVIAGNTVDHLKLGASESVVVNGNVTHWSVVRNHIYDNDNIGIDAIGFEPTLPEPYRYTDTNRARDGVIADNTVARIRSEGNPSYWSDGAWCNCADGIYVDGGTRIVIRGNTVQDNDIGIEVAAENARGSADHVLVTRNSISGSRYVGIATGGYCNGAEACGGVETGTSHDNTFTRNVLRGDNQLDDGSPEVLVQYHASHDTFTRNDIVASNSDHVVYGTVPDSDSHDNRSDHNVFSATGATAAEAVFGWLDRTWTGFDAYRSATGQDRHSRFR
ncbi:parallel beta-helix repeat protein [Motilibacter rhizosphaerae]|uniref:Parallel beta-helix repeat protein n=1 Tax=Motilibacter rhizosphaerae TaxID=598652 RepID=A0A4Q7NUY1_9ACTN|nr:right-handed parallel beta-helix repeat-containing protein [Motilibacter rhizosphaerae]RZS90904.1 parallel beta-helix repeat protein [Motilibacter rhizosphaerae]